MKYVAAKQRGIQIRQSRSHFATGYSANELRRMVTGMIIIGWNM